MAGGKELGAQSAAPRGDCRPVPRDRAPLGCRHMHRDSLSHVSAGAISSGSRRKLQAARMGLTPMATSSAAKPRGRGSSGTPHGCHKGVFSSRWLLNGVGGRVQPEEQVPSERSLAALQAFHLEIFLSVSCPQRDHAKLLLGRRNVCLSKDDTVRNKAEENKPLSQMNSAGQALAASKYRAND